MDINSLYIHFPYCLKFCNYCDFYRRVVRNDDFESYHQLLLESIKVQDDFFNKNYCRIGTLDTLYIGGGTPSCWGNKGILFLDRLINNRLKLSDNYEFTIEVNPGTNVIEDLDSWNSLGVNRYSVGLQSFDSTFLKILERVHDREDVIILLEQLVSKKINYSVDLMLGLPYSKLHGRDIISELEQLFVFSPAHISMYILTVDNQYKYYADLPDDEWIRDEYLRASEFLMDNGYIHYEISNWAKKNKYSEHNLNYWKLGSWASLGPSSTGNINLGNHNLRYRWDNQKPSFDIEEVDFKATRLEKIFLGLRTNIGIHPQELFRDGELNIFYRVVKKWKRAGYLLESSERIVLNDSGYLLLNSLIDDLFLNIKSL